MNECKTFKPIGITVIPGVQVTIIVPEQYLFNKEEYTLKFCLTKPEIVEYSTIVGNEVVYIQNGVGGELYQLLDCAANIFYGSKLIFNKCCNPVCYRLRFGNNGLPSSVEHFINLNTPKFSRAYNPSNAETGTIVPTATTTAFVINDTKK